MERVLARNKRAMGRPTRAIGMLDELADVV